MVALRNSAKLPSGWLDASPFELALKPLIIHLTCHVRDIETSVSTWRDPLDILVLD